MRSDGARAALEAVAARARPVALAREHVLPVLEPLRPLLPDGLPRGTTIAIERSTSLALALAAGPAGEGSWVAGIGLASLGLTAAHELGVPLDRLVLVAAPATSSSWATAVATLLDAFDLVLVRPAQRVGAGDARRLGARARERGAVLVVLDEVGSGAGAGRGRWPEAPDARLAIVEAQWQGLGDGHGHLMARRVVVAIEGRRQLARPRRTTLLLPAPGGGIATADPATTVVAFDPAARAARAASSSSGVDVEHPAAG